jgi:tRNA/tmRNA/rRNA uracil-C5-methylase (TrmA/RlmC/RlmD family)
VGKKKKFNDHPFPYHHELEMEVATLTNLGVGLGRVPLATDGPDKSSDGRSPQDEGAPEIENRESKIKNPPSGWVIMVPFTLPGEKVRVRIYRNHKNFSEADLLAVLTPSPHRITPRCELFGRCGGCQYQHLTYGEQLKWKRQQVEEVLKFMAGVEFPVSPVIASPKEFGYRSKITPHFKAWSKEQGAGEPAPIGFLKQGSRFDLVDVPACDIATAEINAKLPEVRAKTRQRLAAGEYKRDATLLLRHAQEGVITDYDAVIHEVIGFADCGSGGGF